jgi:hypothetical protein
VAVIKGSSTNILGTPVAPHWFVTALHAGGVNTFTYKGVNYNVDTSFVGRRPRLDQWTAQRSAFVEGAGSLSGLRPRCGTKRLTVQRSAAIWSRSGAERSAAHRFMAWPARLVMARSRPVRARL